MERIKIGDRLRKLRGGKTASVVAEAVGVSTSAMLMYEADERVPRDEIKVRIANYYGVSVGSLFFGE